MPIRNLLGFSDYRQRSVDFFISSEGGVAGVLAKNTVIVGDIKCGPLCRTLNRVGVTVVMVDAKRARSVR